MKLRVNCLIIRMCVDRLLSANRTEFIDVYKRQDLGNKDRTFQMNFIRKWALN